jgi:hypothetical protein
MTTTQLSERWVTVDDVMAWGPCRDYPRDRVAALWGEHEALNAEQILDLDIPATDRLWAVLRRPFLDDHRLRLFAADCAERALRRERAKGHEPDPRSWAAVEAARRFARGEITREALGAARGAAWNAAWNAARGAARNAARGAAWNAAGDAARDAAGDAAWNAARNAARGAAWNAAGNAERLWQIARLREYLRKEVT